MIILPNRSDTNFDGYGDSGFKITFINLSIGEIHYDQTIIDPAGGSLIGIWQSDSRNTDPVSGFRLHATKIGSLHVQWHMETLYH